MEIKMYKIKCEICGKIKVVENNPYSETFLCKKCINELPEPKRGDFESFTEYFNAIENWRYKTKKTTTYDYNNFKDDLLSYYNVKGEKAKKTYDLAYSYGHSGGYQEIISYFDDLVELIK